VWWWFVQVPKDCEVGLEVIGDEFFFNLAKIPGLGDF
jgi:hypothetical protein